MLTKFREGANNIFVRILLALVALSFVGFGASSFLGGNSRGDIVSFTKAKSISAEDFLAIKSQQLDQMQREYNVNFTEEQIKELGLDRDILQKLVNESMISYLASIYDFDISDEAVINFVKKIPYFKDENGNFDLKLFKSAFHNSKRQEDAYLDGLKANLIKNSLLDVFMESFKPSKLMVNNVVDYMADTKYYDLITIDLTYKKADFKNDQIDPKELEAFYQKNENDFVLPETRSFDYISIGKDFFAKKIDVSDEDIKTYYDENQNEFDGKAFAAVKKEVQNILFVSKLEELLVDFGKTLEEDVATGISLKDIAEKYTVKISSVPSISQFSLTNDDKLNLSEISDSVFEMLQNEVSYPIELLDQNRIILVELKSITPSRKQEFQEVKGQIYSILQDRYTYGANMKVLEYIKNNYDPAKVTAASLKEQGISFEQNKALARVDLQEESKINLELAYSILKTDKNQTTPLVRNETKAYFAYIKSEKINKDKAKKIADTSLKQISNAIREGLMQELIGHLTEVNEMKVKLD